MSLLLPDERWETCVQTATEVAALRGTEHGFIEWFAKALFDGQQVLYLHDVPETEGDLDLLKSDIGDLLVVAVGEEPLVKALPKAANTSGVFTTGRGKNKKTVVLSRITHKAPPAPPKRALHIRKPSGFENPNERAALGKQVAEKATHAQSPEQIQADYKQRQQIGQEALHAQPKGLGPHNPNAKVVPSLEEMERQAKPRKMDPKTGEAYPEPQPGDRWITVHPWGEAHEGMAVMVHEIKGHKGEFLTLAGPPGVKGMRLRHIRTITPEDVASEHAQKRKLDAQSKWEARQKYNDRLKQEQDSDRNQSKYAQIENHIKARLSNYRDSKGVSHAPYTQCPHEDCLRVAKDTGLPVIHLMRDEQARAALIRTQPGQSPSANAIRQQRFRTIDATLRWLDKQQDLAGRALTDLSKFRVGNGHPDTEVQDQALSEATKALAIASHLTAEIALAKRRIKNTAAAFEKSSTPEERKMAERALEVARSSIVTLEQELGHHRQLARVAHQYAKQLPEVDTALTKDRSIPKDKLQELGELPASIDEFAHRIDMYKDGVTEKALEYSAAIPKIEAQLKDVRSGKVTGAPPGKTSVKVTESVRNPNYNPFGEGDEREEFLDMTRVVGSATAAQKAQILEAQLNRELNRAKILREYFDRARDTLNSATATAATQRKVVQYALSAEQEDDKRLLATYRIKAAAEKAKAEGTSGRMKAMATAKPIVRLPGNMTAEDLALDQQLSAKIAEAQKKYIRDVRTAEKSKGITIPMGMYGELATKDIAAEAEKTIKHTYQTEQLKKLIDEAYDPSAATLLGEDRDQIEQKYIIDNMSNGMYSAYHTMSVGMAAMGMVDPSVVNVLGQEGTAMAMAAYLRKHDPAKIPLLREKMEKWEDHKSGPLTDDVLDMADELLEEAKEIRAALNRREGTPVDVSEMRGLTKALKFRVQQYVKLTSYALGQQRAAGSFTGALKESPRDLDIAIKAKHSQDVADQMNAMRLTPSVKEGDAGDYTVRKVGNDQWVVKIKNESLARVIRPTHEQMFTPEMIEQSEQNKNGVRWEKRDGKWQPVYLDDPGWLPALFSRRQVGKFHGMEKQFAKDRLAGAESGTLKTKLQRAIGELGLRGMDHREIREYLNADRTLNEMLPQRLHAEARKTLQKLLPGADGKFAEDKLARRNTRDFVKMMLDGSGDSNVDSQELDELFARQHLANSFAEKPHHILAYKPLDQMDGSEKELLKRWWSTNVAGVEYGSRDEQTEGKAAWRYFMRKAGGEHEALELAQEVLKDEHIGKIAHHVSSTGAKMKLGGKKLARAGLLDERAYSGPLAGLQERRSLGTRAEAQLAKIAPSLIRGVKANQPPVKKLNTVSMYGEHVRQQRAIKQLQLVKRLAVLTEPGSGKTAMGAGGFTEARQRFYRDPQNKGKPFRSLWVVPASLIANDQINGDLSKFIAPGELKWHAKPIEGRERLAQRLALMRDPHTDIYATSPESLRDDLLDMIVSAKEGIDAPSSPAQKKAADLDWDTKRKVTEKELRDLIKAGEWQRVAGAVKSALAKQGIEFQHAFVDEGHRLANRAGKQESQMSELITGMTDNIPMMMLATASPAENDFTEVLDLLRKIKPELFAKRQGKDGLRSPYEHLLRAYKHLASKATTHELERGNKTPGGADDTDAPDIDIGSHQALRREISPAVFNVPKDPDESRVSEWAEEKVHLSAEQKKQLELARAYSATARAYWTNPVGAIRAMRWLAPARFEGVDEGDTEAANRIAQRLVGSVETLRRTAMDRILHTGVEGNAKTDKLAALVLNDRRLRSPKTGKPSSGIVFVNLIKSADDVAMALRKKGIVAHPITSKTNPADITRFEREFKATQGTEKQVVLVVSPTASVGKEYQQGAWTVHYDLPHSSYQLTQREGRINRTGQEATHLHNLRLVAHNDDNTKHELEMARERVILSKAPLMGLLQHDKVGRDDTELAHLLSLEEMVRPEPQEGARA